MNSRGLLFGLMVMALAAHAAPINLSYTEQNISIDSQRHMVRLPEGYRLELLNDAMDGPRLLRFGPGQDLFIGSKSGKIYRLSAPYDSPQVLLRLNDYPHSVAFRDGEILIAQTHGLYRAPYQSGQATIKPSEVTRLAPLPGGGGHSSRTVAVGPDGRIYVSLGIAGNCSDEYLGEGYPFERRRGGMLVLNKKGTERHWQIFASGLRNPVGFDWHPPSGVMYASNNGPDHLGFNKPPEYFSKVTPNSFHGMPWFQFDGKSIERDDCIASRPPRPRSEVQAPVATFLPRNAPMGVAFVPAGAMEKKFEFDAVVALRGSWGTAPRGTFFGDTATRRPPKLVIIRFENDKVIRVEDLVSGFQLPNGKRWARPVGVAFGPDGALYFTSDSGTEGLFRLSRIKGN